MRSIAGGVTLPSIVRHCKALNARTLWTQHALVARVEHFTAVEYLTESAICANLLVELSITSQSSTNEHTIYPSFLNTLLDLEIVSQQLTLGNMQSNSSHTVLKQRYIAFRQKDTLIK